MTFCPNCGCSLTSTDFEAGYCTNCNHELTTEETTTMKPRVKPLAKPAEKPASDKWVVCRKHFGVHLERITCEKPRS